MHRGIWLAFGLIAAPSSAGEAAFVVDLKSSGGPLAGLSITSPLTSMGPARSLFGLVSSPGTTSHVETRFHESSSRTGAPETLRITDRSAVAASRVVTGFNRLSPTAADAYSMLVLGGTASRGEYSPPETSPASVSTTRLTPHDPAKGLFLPTQFDQETIHGSIASLPLTLAALTGNPPGPNYSGFFGVAVVPEPSSILLCGVAGLFGALYLGRDHGWLMASRRGA